MCLMGKNHSSLLLKNESQAENFFVRNRYCFVKEIECHSQTLPSQSGICGNAKSSFPVYTYQTRLQVSDGHKHSSLLLKNESQAENFFVRNRYCFVKEIECYYQTLPSQSGICGNAKSSFPVYTYQTRLQVSDGHKHSSLLLKNESQAENFFVRNRYCFIKKIECYS